MAVPRALVLTGYGINCDDETAFAVRNAGGDARIVHVNDLIDNPSALDDYQMMLFPGGFSYGDDTGSGKALAARIRNNLAEPLSRFMERDTLMLGICNGFQVLAALGAVPATAGYSGTAEAALERNESARYQCRWVDLEAGGTDRCVFLRGIRRLHVPVAHGEGRFYAAPATMDAIGRMGLAVLRYVKPDGSPARGEFPFNPNGAMDDIAGVCSPDGRVLGMMPHPERAVFFTQRDDWTLVRERLSRQGKDIPESADGAVIFENAVKYFS